MIGPASRNDVAGAASAISASILLVDDQPKNLLALEAILEEGLDVELIRASSGPEALKHLLTREFAVIILDVQMPGMDGFETARLIKDRERSRHIPIIFLTAISKEDMFVFRGYTVGAVDYISKPFDPDILRSKVRVFVDLYRKTELLKQQEQALRERQLAELRRSSERRYRDLAESMPQIVWMADPDGTIAYGNRRWFDCAQEPPGDGALRWEMIVHPGDRARLLEIWRGALETGEGWEGEFCLGSLATGEFRWHLVRGVPLHQERESIVSWVGTCTDIHDRRQAEDALRFLAHASTLLSSLDYAGAFREVATLAFESGEADAMVVERRAADGRLTPVVSVGLGEGEEIAPAIAQGVLTTGEAALTIERGDGPTAPRSILCAPIVTREGTFGTLTLVASTRRRRYQGSDVELARDLARRMGAAVDIAELYGIAQSERAKLELAHKAKDEFLATLSHELRTPLNAMLGWTQLLRAGDLETEEFDRALETIERNAKAQAQLIADLLDVSRIVTGKLHLSVGPVGLQGVIQAAVDAVRLTADAKNIRIHADIGANVRDVMGDPNRLLQVIGNLLSNALKFTPAYGEVTVSLAEHGTNARIVVSDTGQGISAEFLPYVFDRFRQADSTSTRTQGGLGLGLAIVSHIVQRHGGTVRVVSEGAGKGATFTVDLPLLEDSVRSPVDPKAADEPSVSSRAWVELDNLRILLVEDEPDARGMAHAALMRAGAQVTSVCSTPAALEALSADRPDVLISDIGLPGEDGYALIRKVRARERDGRDPGHVLAVALTAYASEEDRQRALGAGFDAHLTKPVEPNQLIALVARLARQVRAKLATT